MCRNDSLKKGNKYDFNSKRRDEGSGRRNKTEIIVLPTATEAENIAKENELSEARLFEATEATS